MDVLEERIRGLPPELRQEVEDFVEFLIEKQLRRRRGKPNFRWAGTLSSLKNKYSSVELQHEISEWMVDKR